MNRALVALGLVYLSSMTVVGRANAQAVVPDATLNTQVTRSGNNFTIDNGITSGTNLFHSFREFSIPTGGSAHFNNATHIQNIFSRVTGGTPSNIDGILRANGTANLFLLNPAGILFGANAQLNIGGSFIGTTATQVQFADGIEFAATASEPPLLTISVPIGLQFAAAPSSIQVQGTGHQLNTPSYFASVNRGSAAGLSVKPGQILALVGGNISMNGGVLTAEHGHLELGSVQSGRVTFNPTIAQWNFQYPTTLGSIQLAARSLLDVSGNGNGSIQVHGSQIRLQDGSLLFSQNQGDQPMRTLHLHASDSLELRGMTADETIGSGLLSEADATGKGSAIVVQARQIDIYDGAQVLTRSYNAGEGGQISVTAIDDIRLIGLSPTTKTTSNIVTNTFGAGKAGDIALRANLLLGSQGGYVGSAPFPNATGRAGDIKIQTNEIEFSGIDPVTKQTSGMGTISFGLGDAGTLTINTRQLRIFDGAIIDTSTYAQGRGGPLIVNASESITVSGRVPGVRLPSFLGSKAPIVNAELQALFGLPPFPTGNPGDLVLRTNRLIVNNGGSISVESDAPSGNAGSIQINAQSVLLDQEGTISARTISGSGGNISLTTDFLRLRRGSSILTSTTGNGNGGNLTIAASVILGLENSDIVANAVQGRGGNINITTQGIIGLQFRNTLTPRLDITNDITASSGVGINGTVQINHIGVDPNSGLIELSDALVDRNQQVATACLPNQGSSFVMTGRGGIPQSPSDLTYPRPWSDLRVPASTPSISSVPSTEPLIEATAWQRNSQTGKIELVAAQARPTHEGITCSGLAPHQSL